MFKKSKIGQSAAKCRLGKSSSTIESITER